jgi:hypothetical protein
MFAEPECPLKGFKKTYMTVFDQKIRIKVGSGLKKQPEVRIRILYQIKIRIHREEVSCIEDREVENISRGPTFGGFCYFPQRGRCRMFRLQD